MLEEVVTGILSVVSRFLGWCSTEGIIITVIIIFLISAVAGITFVLASLPSDEEQKRQALDTYYDCRNVRELSEEACLLLVLDFD